MKFILKALPVVIALFVFVAGCKKDKDAEMTCRLTSIQSTGLDTAQLTYDAEGNLTSYGSLSNYLINLTYSGLTVTTTIANEDTTRQGYNIFLNADKNVQSMNLTNNNGGSNYYYTYTFEYDTEKHVVWSEQTYKQLGTPTIYYYKDSMIYENGNLTEKHTFYKMNDDPYVPFERKEITPGTELNKIGYYAFSSREEPISITSAWHFIYPLFGKASVNLPAKTKVYDELGNLSYEIIYSFLLNGDGYPVDENYTVTIAPPYTINRKFTYTCN